MKFRGLVMAIVLAWATTAQAGGIEVGSGGARATSRGGAVAAKAQDPFVLLHNPAGLAQLPHGHHLMLNVDVPLSDLCFDPYGFYGWGVYTTGDSEFANADETSGVDPGADVYARDPLDEVCNSASTIPVASLAWAWRVNRSLGIGFGFVAPTVVAGQQWGGSDGTIDTSDGARPTPTRYQLIKQEVTGAFAPTIGVGYGILPRLRVGAALTWTGLEVETTVVQTRNAGTSPHDDMLVKLTARDFFMPAATISVHATPVNMLDMVLAFRLIQDFDGSGDVRYTTAAYRQGFDADKCTTDGDPCPVPFKNDPIDVSDVQAGFPWALTFGIRYADLLAPADPGRLEDPDPMSTERFDVELDVSYIMNARAGDAAVTIEEGVIIFRNAQADSENLVVPNPDVDEFNIDRHLKDAVAVRLGGSYNLMPDLLSLSLGGNYETRGVDPDYANIDLFAFSRFSVGGGVTVRLGDFDITAAYAHVFQEDLEVAPPPHQPRDEGDADPRSGFDKRIPAVDGEDPVEDPDAPSPSEADGVAAYKQPAIQDTQNTPARVVNAGLYTSSYDIISVGVNYNF